MASSLGFNAAVKASAKNSAFTAGHPVSVVYFASHPPQTRRPASSLAALAAGSRIRLAEAGQFARAQPTAGGDEGQVRASGRLMLT